MWFSLHLGVLHFAVMVEGHFGRSPNPMIKYVGAYICLSTLTLLLDGAYYQICRSPGPILQSHGLTMAAFSPSVGKQDRNK